MKKTLLVIALVVALGGVLYFAQNQQGNLSSQYFGPSVYIEGSTNAFPIGTPVNTESAIIPITGFTRDRSLMNPFATYQGYYTSEVGGEKYGVMVVAFRRGQVDVRRDTYVSKKIVPIKDALISPQLSVYQDMHVVMQNRIFPNFPSRPTTSMFWMTNFGYVYIFQENVGAKYTVADLEKINWDKVHNDMLIVAEEYIKQYPAVSASEYAKFGPSAKAAMANIDLTKLPEVTKK